METHHTEAGQVSGPTPSIATAREYIVTHDIGRLFQCFSRAPVDLKVPPQNDPLFVGFRDGLVSIIANALPNVNIRAIAMDELSNDILASAMNHNRTVRDAFVVSTCSEIASPRHGATLEINRLYDLSGSFIGLGPRPGHNSIDNQIDAIVKAANGSPIVLVEDGGFSGTTLQFVIEKFHSRCVRLSAVVVGFCFPEARQLLEEYLKGINFDGELIMVQEVAKPVDWMPDHDFVPFGPNCGRVYGIRHGNASPIPYREPSAECSYLSFSFPYLQPFGDPESWASIPKSASNALSRFCLSHTIEIFREMETLNKRRLKIRDIVSTCPRTSVPIDVRHPHFPNASESIVNLLCEARQIIT
jgi:hypothetical protein